MRDVKDAPADGEWRVTCSCKERIGFADTFAAAEALGREHVAARRNSIRKGRHVITLALDQNVNARARGLFRTAANGVDHRMGSL